MGKENTRKDVHVAEIADHSYDLPCRYDLFCFEWDVRPINSINSYDFHTVFRYADVGDERRKQKVVF